METGRDRDTYGVVGVGALATAIVTGLCAGPDPAPEIVLSPRGAQASADLSARFESVRTAPDNQGVLDAASVVLVCLRQRDAGELAGLAWRPDHVVVSAVAGLGPAALRSAVAPATTLARAVPLPAVAQRAWATPVCPAVPQALALFERTGGAVPLTSDEQYDAIYTGLGTVAPFFDYLATIAEFLVDHGVPAPAARTLLASAFGEVLSPLGEEPEAGEGPDFEALLRAHAPPGGGNDQLAALMREGGVREVTRRALEEVHRRQTGG